MKDLFPYFANNEKSIFLDSAASSQIHKDALQKINEVYTTNYSNIHRGLYKQSELTNNQYEATKKQLAKMMKCLPKELIWTKGTTEALNLLANHYYNTLKLGDKVLLSQMEHHANIVPWQRLQEKGIIIEYINVNNGILDMDDFNKKLDIHVKVVSICHASNVTGVINPIKEIIEICKQNGTATIIDAAQSFSHMNIDVKDLDCNFLVFSAHKSYGPNGLGVLYGKYKNLQNLSLYQVGGDTIDTVTYKETVFQSPPHCFEAGTPNIVGVIAFNESLKFLEHHRSNNAALFEPLKIFLIENKFNVIAKDAERVPILSFYHDDINLLDLSYYLSLKNLCFRVGDHCAMPFIKENLGISGTIRFSLGAYNDKDDIDKTIHILKKYLDRSK